MYGISPKLASALSHLMPLQEGNMRLSPRQISVMLKRQKEIVADRIQKLEPTGGIDLNPLNKELSVEGRKDFSFTSKGLQNITINGLVPVVTGVEELKSLPEFLCI